MLNVARVAHAILPEDIILAGHYAAGVLGCAVDRDWTVRAPLVRWTIAETMQHIIAALIGYARNAPGTEQPPALVALRQRATQTELIDALSSAAESLVRQLEGIDEQRVIPHSWGPTDRAGLTAMACDEILVHGYDASRGLIIAYDPPRPLCRRVLERLFPWAPGDLDPFTTLLWANGRRSLPGQPRLPQRWRWHGAPLEEWDGQGPKVGGPRGQLTNWVPRPDAN